MAHCHRESALRVQRASMYVQRASMYLDLVFSVSLSQRSVAAEIKKYKYKKKFRPKLPEVASTRSPSPCESVPRRARSAKLPRTLHAIVIARCRFRRFSAASHFWVRTSFQAGGSRLRSRGRAPAHFQKSSWSGAHPFWPTRAGPNFAAKMPSSAY